MAGRTQVASMEMAMIDAGLIRDTTDDELELYREKSTVLKNDDAFYRRYCRLRHLENLSNQIDNIRS